MSPITSTTHVCAVIGHPIAHSLSPAIHNAGFEALGLPFVYVAHDVSPARLPEAIAGVRALGYRGLSITIPHKVASLSWVDVVDEVAQGIGCINTLVHDDGTLRGYNSDGLGALSALRAAGADPAGAHVAVLGSGGAARAIAMTLVLSAPPSELVVFGVVPDELEKLCGDLRARARGTTVHAARLDPATAVEHLAETELLLNATPVGMHPAVDASPLPAQALRPGMVVFDAVYNPRRTRLLRDAAALGCRTVPGLEMFLGQAMVQFELFTGQEAPADVMRAVLEAKL